LSNPLCYEIMTPESVGAAGNRIVLGKHSGRHALANRFVEMGYTVTAPELESAYRAFTALADRKKNLYEQDLVALLPRARRAAGAGAGSTAAFAD
jgi:2-isopropylmalate synthase